MRPLRQNVPQEPGGSMGSGRVMVHVVIDDPYRDVDLVGLYDLDNPGGEDHIFFRSLADEIGARSIIDLGCGTGAGAPSAGSQARAGQDQGRPFATMKSWSCARLIRCVPGSAGRSSIGSPART